MNGAARAASQRRHETPNGGKECITAQLLSSPSVSTLFSLRAGIRDEMKCLRTNVLCTLFVLGEEAPIVRSAGENKGGGAARKEIKQSERTLIRFSSPSSRSFPLSRNPLSETFSHLLRSFAFVTFASRFRGGMANKRIRLLAIQEGEKKIAAVERRLRRPDAQSLRPRPGEKFADRVKANKRLRV